MKKDLIILHGWNSQVKRWQSLKKRLEKNFKVYLPALPGFGNNKLAYPFQLKDYVNWLEKYLKRAKIRQPIIVAHSFGARIAINFLSQGGKAKKLVLINAAGLKHKKTPKQKLAFFLAKTANLFLSLPPLFVLKKPLRFLLYTFIGEKDYYRADKTLKKTMKNILKKDLRFHLKKVKIPTLILWGGEDKITPLADGLLMAQEIPQARLVVFKKASHSLPFKKPKQIAKLIYQFSCQ